MAMKTCTIVKFIESSNRFNMYIASFMSVCYWLFSQFNGKKNPIFSQSVDLESFQFWFLIFLGRRKSIVPCSCFAVQQEFSCIVAWSSFNMGKDNIFSVDSQQFCSSMVSKKGASLNLKYLQLGPELWN